MAINKLTRFLVIDDYDTMRSVTIGQLKSLGAEKISQAANGKEALRLLHNLPFDIVLSDWNMPVMDGLELLKAVRADEKLKHLPFVMITADAERHRVDDVIACGVSDLLVKPYNAMRLLSRVEKALSWKPRAISAALASLAPALDHHGVELASVPKESVRPTILVVDDTPDNLHLLSSLFNNEYRVLVARNGESALDICTSDNPPDLVLLDIVMLGMDGFEVAKKMREHPNSEHIPLIFVTSMTDNGTRLKGMELGAVDFVTKPIDPAVLIPRVRNFMRYVELHRHLQSDYDTMLENAHLREDVEHITRHDLKGPLSGVISVVQAMIDEGSLNRRQIEQLRMAEETALQVLNMINLTSELYKIETGRFQLDAKPVKIGDILRRIVEISRSTFNEKHLTISVETDVTSVGEEIPQILGDAMLCYSLFQNLIKNACEAAPDNSQVVVTLIDENPLKITIKNKGAVPAPIREHFFDKFVTYGKSGGTGIGTYSAKLLTEAQYGQIALEISDAENLTAITVSLPRFVEAVVAVDNQVTA